MPSAHSPGTSSTPHLLKVEGLIAQRTSQWWVHVREVETHFVLGIVPLNDGIGMGILKVTAGK